MLVVRCPSCAARYRVPEKLGDKKVRCKKCGKPFRIPAPPPQPEPEEDLLSALAAGDALGPSVAPPTQTPDSAVPPAVFPGRERSSTGTGVVQAAPATGLKTYLQDVGKSLLFFTRGGDLVTFVVVVILVCLKIPLAFAPCLGLIGIVIVEGWYMAYRLNVVLGAAAGDQDLPNLTLGEPWEGIILPLLKWLMAWIAALLPFIIGLIYLVVLAQLTASGAFAPFVSALVGDFLSALDKQEGLGWLVGGVLLLLPMTLWPMMLLVVAIGGMRCLIRFDLMIATIIKSFPAYLLVVILAYAGVVGPALLPGDAGLGLAALFVVLQVYANIFVMRVVGLYYHHFKHRFAWSWG